MTATDKRTDRRRGAQHGTERSSGTRQEQRPGVQNGAERLTWKGGTIEAPLPAVLVTSGTMDKANVMTVAWTGIVNTDPPMTYISVRPERYSYEIIRDRREFVINLPTAQMARTVDYCGVKSGRDTDKIAACHLNLLPGEMVRAPLIAECPLQLECRVRQEMALGSHHMFLADILAVRVDPSVVDPSGKLRIDQCGLLAYAHGQYFALGRILGKFGYSVAKNNKKHR
ncbi:MAG: flavin reductase family protein [Firmicutes bacterium]|nr:flavin reductase family protein [Bacillota bacterium]